MRNQGQLILGGLLLFFGILFLIGNIFHIDAGAICWPSLLILFGVWLVVRPRLAFPGREVSLVPLGSVRREGAWRVSGEEIWMFAGDIRLDLRYAEIPPGETHIRIFVFVSDIDLRIPAEAGVSLSSTAFLTSAHFFGEKRDSFLTVVSRTSPGYPAAERKVRIEVTGFVVDLEVDQG